MTFKKCSGFLWWRSLWIRCASIRHLSSAASVPAFSMADSAVLVLRFRSLTYVSNSEIRSLLSIGASRFFGIGGAPVPLKTWIPRFEPRGDAYTRVAWTFRWVKFLLVKSHLKATDCGVLLGRLFPKKNVSICTAEAV